MVLAPQMVLVPKMVLVPQMGVMVLKDFLVDARCVNVDVDMGAGMGVRVGIFGSGVHKRNNNLIMLPISI